MVDCPAEGCEYSGPRQSVVAHYSGKRDAEHEGGYSKAEELVSGESEQSSSSGSTSSSGSSSGSGNLVPDEHQVSSDGGACCDDPALEGSGGELYRLENDDVVKLESGEQICINCDQIHD